MIYIGKKRTISTFFSCFTFFSRSYTWLVVGGQIWLYYIGSKRGKLKACPHSQCCTLFSEGGVVWKIPYYAERGPMGLGQKNSLTEYCGPHTACSVFLMLLRMALGAALKRNLRSCVYSQPAKRMRRILDRWRMMYHTPAKWQGNKSRQSQPQLNSHHSKTWNWSLHMEMRN